MFENLTDRLSQTLRHVTGKAKLTEDNIKDTLREVRMALLEADVALPVVKDFVNSVKERAVGTEVSRSLTPGQAFVKNRPGRTRKPDGRGQRRFEPERRSSCCRVDGRFAGCG